jgi:hypothetical protein
MIEYHCRQNGNTLKERSDRGLTNTTLLKKKIKESGYKIEKIASVLEVSRQTLSNKINNNTDFTVKEMYGLSDFLNIDAVEMKEIFFDNVVDNMTT